MNKNVPDTENNTRTYTLSLHDAFRSKENNYITATVTRVRKKKLSSDYFDNVTIANHGFTTMHLAGSWRTTKGNDWHFMAVYVHLRTPVDNAFLG